MIDFIRELFIIIFVAVAIFTGLILISSWFSRANVYFDTEKARRMDQCLERGLTYQDCYDGIYYPRFKK